MRCVIVTGMSGAGKSTALKMLEDMGYFCVDNLPVPLIPKMAELLSVPGTQINKAALGVDIRSGQSFQELANVLKVLDEVEEKPDMIILDPPRDGIHPKALPKIIKYAVDHIVYISCKPTSLVRDLEVFLENGYRVDKAVAVDQFPWTANVETVVLLSKGIIDSQKVKVEMSLEDMDMSGF